MDKSRLYYLVRQYLAGKLSPAENEEFQIALQEGSDDELLMAFEELTGDLQMAAGRDSSLAPVLQRVLQADRYAEEMPLADESLAPAVTRAPFIKRRWLRYAAAIILCLGAATYLWLTEQKNIETARSAGGNPVKNDIAPGQNGAVLTLADGTQMILDSLGNGVVASQPGTSIVLRNGLLAYETVKDDRLREKNSGTINYNTITTPKGRQFQVVLPDGSKVWLNAASSIRYPTVFQDKIREVEITGEAYFEVTAARTNLPAGRKPFIVKINSQTTVEVLGTIFNINSYTDEESVKTTLLEGSVKVNSGTESSLLKPGEQAQINEKKGGIISDQVKVDQVIAWKNGAFDFQDKSLEEVMRLLSRWYDLEIVYAGKPPEVVFFGKIGRDLNLSQVLNFLQNTGVQFKREGDRKLVVLPSS